MHQNTNDLANVEFSWHVPESGFEWEQKVGYPSGSMNEPVHGWYLGYRDRVGRPARFRRTIARRSPEWTLKEQSGLFRIFASMDPSRDGILAFANRFGMLGSDMVRGVRQPPTVAAGQAIEGEPNNAYLMAHELFETWVLEHHALRQAVQLWEAIEKKDIKALSMWIRWEGPETSAYPMLRVVYQRPQCQFETFPLVIELAVESDAERFSLFRSGDLILPGRHALRRLVNQSLNVHASRAQLTWDRSSGRERVRIVPRSLIAAIWLQFSLAIDGKRTYRECPVCHEPFEVGGEGARADSVYCGRSCNLKAYRARQQRARELSAQGKAPREIAAELDSDVKTIKGWLRK
jgi:hypothetical protein